LTGGHHPHTQIKAGLTVTVHEEASHVAVVGKELIRYQAALDG